MKTYKAFMQRVVATAGPQANFTITVQAVTSAMAKVTAEAQYPGYKCLNAPLRCVEVLPAHLAVAAPAHWFAAHCD